MGDLSPFWVGTRLLCVLKDATAGFHMSKLIATYLGMLFQAFKLGYLYLGQVHLGFVSGAVVCIRLF